MWQIIFNSLHQKMHFQNSLLAPFWHNQSINQPMDIHSSNQNWLFKEKLLWVATLLHNSTWMYRLGFNVLCIMEMDISTMISLWNLCWILTKIQIRLCITEEVSFAFAFSRLWQILQVSSGAYKTLTICHFTRWSSRRNAPFFEVLGKTKNNICNRNFEKTINKLHKYHLHKKW